MVETAVIVAAGLGTRLGERTETKPKGFLRVGDYTLIERSLASLEEAGIRRVCIGTGYHAEHYEALAAARPPVECVYSELYESTGSMYTLYNMRRVLNEPFLLLESDLLYEPLALELLLQHEWPDVVLGSTPTGAGDEVYIETDQAGFLRGMSKDERELASVDSELVGISKISREAYADMCDVMKRRFDSEPRLDYEHALVAVAAQTPGRIRVHTVSDLAWCEIDDESHLRRALDQVLPRVRARGSVPAAVTRRRAV